MAFTVEYFRLLDRREGNGFVLALECSSGYRVSHHIVFDCLDVFGLRRGFPDRDNTWDEGAREEASPSGFWSLEKGRVG